ncbi:MULTISPECIES: hypothetical protein [Acinetobacter]|uniref:Uncharacterized protein n=2 Tax=Gammaproteobacteria TaxID=1236 RepID=A0A7T9UI31_9GAMM|nr:MULTISPECIES: hypothetical protein [Acinetobacter]ENX49406.1 hypothetical protein F943_01806 [Acinetobacter ursingii NIPH 706]MBJ8474300.1 hypothetical protein [Acinetobacter bereziniae]QQT86237.1 hypothetical protein I6I53_15460 [Acinetobacter ursingii]WEH87910.1 hypothetical protein PX669_08715 [Acinetobacter soli]WEI10233.1 hypothetical protein PYR73_04125 [Acinetobacter soli]
MRCMIKKILVTSISLLMIHTATAHPISASSLTLEEGLSCLDWAEKEQSFNNQLALADRADISTPAIVKLQKQFRQQYHRQKTIIIDDSDDEGFCQDCPETAVYLPIYKSNPIQRIETSMHVSVAGASTSIYRRDDIATTKQKIESGLNIKFRQYTGQQFKSFKQQWDKASMHDDQNRSKTQKVFQQYPHLKVFNGEIFQNQKIYTPKQIYIYSQPYKRDTSYLNDMIAFISLYDNPVNSSQHILQCGFIDNVF